jgi:predicted short-subunit dehydrogenase-like oxidoreductase (DUF2520 family)
MKLSIIGTGNVAHQLGGLLKRAGIGIADLHGRSSDKTKELAIKLNCAVTESIAELTGDLIVVCVTDDVIPEILSSIPTNKKAVYTSGSVQLNACGRKENTGVLYPLQTLKKGEDLHNSDLPLLIEAQSDLFLAEIEKLALMISKNVHQVTSENRLLYHLSAIWMNNFTNHLIYISQKLLEDRNLNSELLRPLLLETFDRLKLINPRDSQTGPARRGDIHILKLHESLLNKEQRLLYKLLSESIQDTYRTDEKL